MANHHQGHRQRVKQEFREHGMEHFPPHKALEMMLFYAVAREDTNPIAHRLIERFGSLCGVLEAPYELLLEVDGIGPEAATYIKAMLAFSRRYVLEATGSRKCLKTAADAMEYMRHRFISDASERVLLVCLGAGDRIVYSGCVASGTLERVDLVPADIVRTSLRADAARVILAHNHPGGICNPSRRDLNATFMLQEALSRVSVELADHIIVADDGVFSMSESGMLPKSGHGM